MTKSHKSSGNGKRIDNPSCLQSIQSDKIKKESLDDGKRKWRLVSQWEKEETDYEKYLRIKEANDAKEKRMSDRAIKKLKREGKVRSIAGFLVCKDKADDDWTKLKMARYKKKTPLSAHNNNSFRETAVDNHNHRSTTNTATVLQPFLNARTNQPVLPSSGKFKK